MVACADDARAPSALRAAQRIANDTRVPWHEILIGANGVARAANTSDVYNALKSVQFELEQLPVDTSSRWLAQTMVNSRVDTRPRLHWALSVVPCDFSVFHFDARNTADPAYQAYATEPWYRDSKRIVHRGFKSGTGCHVEAIRGVLAWLLQGARSYSHLWLLDNDMDFRLFSFEAFRALVAYRRPLVCQPAMLAGKRGARATDRQSLRFQPDPQHMAGRARITDIVHRVPMDDVDNQPLIDRALFAPLAAALETLDSRHQVAQAQALNIIARALATASGTKRPAGLVFDWVPLIHMDTRLLGWGARAYSLKNGTACPRVPRIPGSHIGNWSEAARPAIEALAREPCR